MSLGEGNVYAHKPVLLEPVLSLLRPAVGGRGCYVDATVGEGGHMEALLAAEAGLEAVGVDQDEEILARAAGRLARFGSRVRLLRMGFGEFFRRYREFVDTKAGGILFDLGISMYHYECSGRGFSLRRDEPLDMRLDRSRGCTAAELLESLDEE